LMKISYSKAILIYNIKSFGLCPHMVIIIEKVKMWMCKDLVWFAYADSLVEK